MGWLEGGYGCKLVIDWFYCADCTAYIMLCHSYVVSLLYFIIYSSLASWKLISFDFFHTKMKITPFRLSIGVVKKYLITH